MAVSTTCPRPLTMESHQGGLPLHEPTGAAASSSASSSRATEGELDPVDQMLQEFLAGEGDDWNQQYAAIVERRLYSLLGSTAAHQAPAPSPGRAAETTAALAQLQHSQQQCQQLAGMSPAAATAPPHLQWGGPSLQGQQQQQQGTLLAYRAPGADMPVHMAEASLGLHSQVRAVPRAPVSPAAAPTAVVAALLPPTPQLPQAGGVGGAFAGGPPLLPPPSPMAAPAIAGGGAAVLGQASGADPAALWLQLQQEAANLRQQNGQLQHEVALLRSENDFLRQHNTRLVQLAAAARQQQQQQWHHQARGPGAAFTASKRGGKGRPKYCRACQVVNDTATPKGADGRDALRGHDPCPCAAAYEAMPQDEKDRIYRRLHP